MLRTKQRAPILNIVAKCNVDTNSKQTHITISSFNLSNNAHTSALQKHFERYNIELQYSILYLKHTPYFRANNTKQTCDSRVSSTLGYQSQIVFQTIFPEGIRTINISFCYENQAQKQPASALRLPCDPRFINQGCRNKL